MDGVEFNVPRLSPSFEHTKKIELDDQEGIMKGSEKKILAGNNFYFVL